MLGRTMTKLLLELVTVCKSAARIILGFVQRNEGNAVRKSKFRMQRIQNRTLRPSPKRRACYLKHSSIFWHQGGTFRNRPSGWKSSPTRLDTYLQRLSVQGRLKHWVLTTYKWNCVQAYLLYRCWDCWLQKLCKPVYARQLYYGRE